VLLGVKEQCDDGVGGGTSRFLWCFTCTLSAATVREAHVTLLACGCFVFPLFCFPVLELHAISGDSARSTCYVAWLSCLSVLLFSRAGTSVVADGNSTSIRAGQQLPFPLLLYLGRAYQRNCIPPPYDVSSRVFSSMLHSERA